MESYDDYDLDQLKEECIYLSDRVDELEDEMDGKVYPSELLSVVLATLDFPDNLLLLPKSLQDMVGKWKQEYEKITGKHLWEVQHEYLRHLKSGAVPDLPTVRPRTRKVSKKAVR